MHSNDVHEVLYQIVKLMTPGSWRFYLRPALYPGDRQGTLIIIMQSFGYIVKSVPVDQTGPRISISPMRGSKFHMELQLF